MGSSLHTLWGFWLPSEEPFLKKKLNMVFGQNKNVVILFIYSSLVDLEDAFTDWM